MRRLFLALLALAVAAQAEAQGAHGPASKVVLLLQDYSQSHDCYDAIRGTTQPCALLLDALLTVDERKYRAKLAEQYTAITRGLPQLDLPKVTREAFCPKLAPDAVDCIGPQLAGGSKEPLRLDAGALLLRIAVSMYHEGKRRGLRVIVPPHAIGRDGVPAPPAFYAWYDTRAAQPSGDPFADAASRAHWFDGPTPKLEVELRQAMQDTAELVRLMRDRQATSAAGFERWWAELPTLRELRDAGTLECRGMECRSKYLAVHGDRVWYAPDTGGVPVLSSVPLADFRR